MIVIFDCVRKHTLNGAFMVYFNGL